MRGIALFTGILLAFAVSAAERILDFHSDIRIATNGDLTVTERIAVEAEGGFIHTGIRRDFAPALPGAGSISVRRVTRNGAPEAYAVESHAGGVRIRTGRADAPLEHGRHVYEIAYRSSRQVGFLDTHDELRWSVTGHGWSLALERISAEVQLPARVPARELKPEARTGLQDARGGDYRSLVRDGAAAFRSTRAFRPGEGLTIVVAFPKGVVAPPSAGQRARWFVADNAWALAGIGVLLLAVSLSFYAWARR